MGAVFSARDKIDVVVLLRVSGSFEAGEARRADGAGRQAGMLVGVVGVALVVEMFAPQIAVETFPEPVGRGGIGLEQHVEPQPVGVYPGDAGPLGGYGCFPFDDGGQRDQTPYLVAPGRARALAAWPERAVLRQKLSISRPTTDFAVASLSSSGRMIR